VDERTAWAAFVGNPGVTFPYVLHTTDGGATWFTQTLPAEANFGLKSIKGVSRMEAWAATLDGVILHTTDGGATWTSHPAPRRGHDPGQPHGRHPAAHLARRF
jgi:photosystem II stability/assembly factor-like uncharacterized protein